MLTGVFWQYCLQWYCLLRRLFSHFCGVFHPRPQNYIVNSLDSQWEWQVVLWGPAGRTVQDGIKAETQFTATSDCVCVCVLCRQIVTSCCFKQQLYSHHDISIMSTVVRLISAHLYCLALFYSKDQKGQQILWTN